MKPMPTELERALALLGPLEARVMRLVWRRQVPEEFVVRDVQRHLSELAYTTVMTTVHRLADKGLLAMDRATGRQPHVYRAIGGPRDHLVRSGREEADALVARFGDAALAAFSTRLDALSPAHRERLRRLIDR